MTDEIITTLSFNELPPDDESAWERFDAMTDEEVEADAMTDPDNPPLTEEELNQFRRAIYVKGECVWEDDKTIGELLAEASSVAMIPVDKDIAVWFKAQGQDYQARINAVLRDYVLAHQNV
ncbi:BrnA antitoxin family protein [Candidatus Poribacteria bacterium]|nr:BrnA antitoxin family protein [Candidatus Poribacteria bacterium]